MAWVERAFTIAGDNLDGRTVYVTHDDGDDEPVEIQISGNTYDLVDDEAVQRDVS